MSDELLTDDQVATRVQSQIKASTRMAFNETAIFTRIGANQWVQLSDERKEEVFDDESRPD